MKKKIFDGFSKIKQKFENITATPEEIKIKEIKNRVDYLINEFSNLSIKTNHTIDAESKNELDYYYRLNDNNDNPIMLIAVVGFHHKKGSIVESFYPTKEEIHKTHQSFLENMISKENSNVSFPQVNNLLDDILNQLTYFCLPDAVHNTNEDAQFFFIQNYKTLLYGISCYRQLKTTSLEVDDENTRDCVQKAMCIVSKVPLFGLFYSKLYSTTTAFFCQNTLKDKLIIEQLYANYESISFKNLNINEIFMSFSLRKLFMFCKEKIFCLLKLILLEKKIIVYSHVSNNVCSFILSLISLIPGNSLFNLNLGNSVKAFIKSINMYGLPLRTHNSTAKLFPIFTLFDFAQIENNKSFLIGTTNQMVLNHNKIKYDCIVNIDTQKITISNEIPEKILKLSKEEKTTFNNIFQKIKNNFNDNSENWMINMNLYDPIFEGSDDFIRNEFKSYFFEYFINISLAMQISNNINHDSIHLSILTENDVGSNSSDEEEHNVENGEKVTTKNKKTQKQKKEHEKNIVKSVKKVLNGYNIDFICNWTHTTNFKFWVNNHDKSLGLRSEYVKQASNISIVYDNGDVYVGSLSRGKKNGFGVLNEYATNSVYNGNWENDLKCGNGCLTSVDNKNIYDGEWKDNKRHGSGQLISNKFKYSGGFKNDLYNGSGILCDSEGNIYEGDFFKGNFQGMGHFKSNTGEVYIGQFVKNLFEGKGQLTSPDGNIYNGDFYQSKKHGEGLLMLTNGDKYEGTFSDDKFEGEGVYTYSNGDVKNGLWKNGKLVDEDD